MSASPLREYMFGTGSTVPGDFLNHLEDLLYSYADSIVPTSTGTQILIQATAGDEAQVTIDREMWISATSLLAPAAGPSGIYDIYVGASTVPTAHATGIKSFDLAVGTTPPPYDHVRHVGVYDWSGSQISHVRLDPRRLNAAQLDGYVPTTSPIDEIVPVASSNGKLDNGFRPIFPGVDAELGEVVDFWSPPSSPFVVPSCWALCNGAVIASGSHDFGPFPLQLPDLRDRFIYGANPSAAIGAAGAANDLAAGAPGIGGVKAAHLQDSALSHSHSLPNHSHTTSHGHGLANHEHDIGAHRHHVTTAAAGIDWPNDSVDDRNINMLNNAGDCVDGFTGLSEVKTTINHLAAGGGSNFDVNTTFVDPGTDAPTPTSDPNSPPIEGRPWFTGFARIMKVRNP